MAHEPGWDANAIARIAKAKFGGTRQMFEAQGWPERGLQMMIIQQKPVKKTNGCGEAFVRHFEDGK